MSDLSDRIVKYAEEYYEGHPSVSDATFDALVEHLKQTEPDNPLLNTVGWGYVVNTDMVTATHRYNIAKFENKVRDSSLIAIPHERAKASVKIDGGSICCYYTNGNLEVAITRGDGKVGYNVTDKMKFIVPQKLVDNTFTGMVRGEITMTLDTFNKYYVQDYESVRNLAIGMIKRTSISMEELHLLDFVAYTVRGTSTQSLNSKLAVYNWLNTNYFNCVDSVYPTQWTDDELRNIIKSYNKYLIDGIVVTDNLYDLQSDNTWVPHSEIAYKTAADTATVTVEDVTWNLTRTGLLYPRVWFTPVKLSGATVRKATAFNADFIESNGIGKGATLVVQRSGEVIPDVVEVINKVEPALPTKCPECGTDLVWKGVHLCCDNPSCAGKNVNELLHWIHNVAGIKGLGDTIILDYLDAFSISNITELYENRQYSIDHIDKISGNATRKLLLEMLNLLVEPIPFDEFMLACNLRMVGHSACGALKKYMKLILDDPIDSAWESQVRQIEGVNATGKKSIIDSIDRIRLYSTYIKVIDSTATATSATVDPTNIVTITGKLSMTRKEFVEEINKYGWTEGPINKAKYLVTDNPNSGSSKCKNAQRLNVPIISESDFMKLIRTN